MRSSDGNDSDDGSTWALAKATLNGAVTAWSTTGHGDAGHDIICVEDNHAETTAATVTLSPTGSTWDNPVEVFSVSDVDDSYSPRNTGPGTPQVAVTGANNLDFDAGYWSIYGLYVKSAQYVFAGISSNDRVQWRDGYVEAESGLYATFGGGRFTNVTLDFDGVSSSRLPKECFNCTIKEGDTSGTHGFMDRLSLYWEGVDWSAGTTNVTFVDTSTIGGNRFTAYLVNSEVVDTFSLTDGTWAAGGGSHVCIVSTDDTTGAAYRQECEWTGGTVTTDTAVYHDNGIAYTEGATRASFKLASNATADLYHHVCTLPGVEWVDITGNTATDDTLDVEIITSQTMNESEVWLEAGYLGTTGRTLVTWDNVGGDIGGSTALAAGTGLANWTGEGGGYTSYKLTSTFDFAKTGLISWRVCMTDASATVYVDTTATVTVN